MANPKTPRNLCIHALLRSAQRYHYASLQDQNPIVAARHNGYAVALIDALRDIATEGEVGRVAGVSLTKIRREILDVQDYLEGEAFKILQRLKAEGVDIGLGQAGGCKVLIEHRRDGKLTGERSTYSASARELEWLKNDEIPDRKLIQIITTDCLVPIKPAPLPEPEPVPAPEPVVALPPAPPPPVTVPIKPAPVVTVPTRPVPVVRRPKPLPVTVPIYARGRVAAPPPGVVVKEEPKKKAGFPWWILIPAAALIA